MSRPVIFHGVAYNLLLDGCIPKLTTKEFDELKCMVEYDKARVVRDKRARIPKQRLEVKELVGLPVLFDHVSEPIGRVTEAYVRGSDIKVHGEIYDNSFKHRVRNGEIRGLSLKFNHTLGEDGTINTRYLELSITKDPVLPECGIEFALSNNSKKKPQPMSEQQTQAQPVEETPMESDQPKATPQVEQPTSKQQFDPVEDSLKRKLESVRSTTPEELIKITEQLILEQHVQTKNRIQAMRKDFKEMDLSDIETNTLVEYCSTAPTLCSVIEKILSNKRSDEKAAQPVQPTQPTQTQPAKNTTNAKQSVGNGLSHQPKAGPSMTQTQKDVPNATFALSSGSSVSDILAKYGARTNANFEDTIGPYRASAEEENSYFNHKRLKHQ